MNPTRKLALLLGSTVSALLLAEAGLRLCAPEARSTQPERPVTGWSSDEYRQFDPQAAREATGTRILVLGDSFLAKPADPKPDRRFPTLLQARLGARVAIRTLAAEGWGTDQEFLAFMEKGREWAPDVVLLAFCANNDIANICSHDHGPEQLKPYFVLGPDERLQLYDGYGAPLDLAALFERRPARWRLADLARSALRADESAVRAGAADFRAVDPRYRRFRFWEEHLEELFFRQDTLSWSPQAGVNHVSAYIHEDFESNAYQWRLLDAILAELDAEVQRAGARLVVLLLPVSFDPRAADTIVGGSFAQRFETPEGAFTFRSDEPRERLRAISGRLGLDFVDPTPEFIRRVLDDGLMQEVWPDPRDRHFSARGHELLADYLERHGELLDAGR